MKKIAKKKSVSKKVNPVKKVKITPTVKVSAKVNSVKKVKVTPIVKVSAKGKANITAEVKSAVSGPYEEIKMMLIQQKKALLLEAGVILENTLNPANEVFADWTDQASVEADQNFVLRLREREQQFLMKIDDAIERIDEGTFGLCEACGGEISIKRLKVRPVTTLCIMCKTKQEMEEKVRQE